MRTSENITDAAKAFYKALAERRDSRFWLTLIPRKIDFREIRLALTKFSNHHSLATTLLNVHTTRCISASFKSQLYIYTLDLDWLKAPDYR